MSATPFTDANAIFGDYVRKDAPMVSASLVRELEIDRDQLAKAARWAEESLVRATHYANECACEPCPECGKMPDECSDTDCAQTCQCSTCDHCHFVGALDALRRALVGSNVQGDRRCAASSRSVQ